LQGLGFTDDAKQLLIGYADGDARRLLNFLEQIKTAAATEGVTEVGVDYIHSAISHGMRRFDKSGDEFYDQISALHKSLRGSSPDATLYWMCRMLDGGADPLYIARRLIRAAVEDIGLADPRALRIALDASETYERLGSPEGELALAQAALYLACAPKSNAAYLAYNKTRSFIAGDKSHRVPEHLRNAPTKLMKELGFGREYRYAHDDPEAYAAGENYFPENMPVVKFYEPTARGLEGKISERLAHLRELDKQAKKKT
jgi:putative ATPase